MVSASLGTSLSGSFHVVNTLNFKHFFCIGLDLIHFMSEPSVDFVNRRSILPLLRVEMQSVGLRWDVSGFLDMVITGKDLCKSVTEL